MLFLLTIGVLFVSFHYYKLADKYNRNVLLTSFLGGLSYFLINALIDITLAFLMFSLLKFGGVSQLIISCFSIPISLLLAGIVFKILESNWKRENIAENNSISEIGKFKKN